ncbi:MAG: hypothetical protein Q8O00_06355 [Holophaga sp.]|nr:hypothetical protein [Holophaga sp.]
MGRLAACLPLAGLMLVAPTAPAQPLGQLLYTNPVGRGISLKVIDGGQPTLMSLQVETGDAEVFRQFVIRHSGPENLATTGAYLLPEKAPANWKVKGQRSDGLLKTSTIIYWRYASNWVIPVRFRLLGQEWRLLSAELAERPFVLLPGRSR